MRFHLGPFQNLTMVSTRDSKAQECFSPLIYITIESRKTQKVNEKKVTLHRLPFARWIGAKYRPSLRRRKHHNTSFWLQFITQAALGWRGLGCQFASSHRRIFTRFSLGWKSLGCEVPSSHKSSHKGIFTRFLTLGWSLGYQFASSHKGVFPTDTTPQKNYKNNTGVDYPSHIGKTRVYWLQPGYELLLTGIEVHTYQVIYTYLIPVPIPSVNLPYYTKHKSALDCIPGDQIPGMSQVCELWLWVLKTTLITVRGSVPISNNRPTQGKSLQEVSVCRL